MSLDQLLLGLTYKTVFKIFDTPQHSHSHLWKKMVVRPCLNHLSYEGQMQCLKPVFLALERLLDRRIVMAYLVYIMTSRPVSTTKWNPVSNGSLKSPSSDCSDHVTSCHTALRKHARPEPCVWAVLGTGGCSAVSPHIDLPVQSAL